MVKVNLDKLSVNLCYHLPKQLIKGTTQNIISKFVLKANHAIAMFVGGKEKVPTIPDNEKIVNVCFQY